SSKPLLTPLPRTSALRLMRMWSAFRLAVVGPLPLSEVRLPGALRDISRELLELLAVPDIEAGAGDEGDRPFGEPVARGRGEAEQLTGASKAAADGGGGPAHHRSGLEAGTEQHAGLGPGHPQVGRRPRAQPALQREVDALALDHLADGVGEQAPRPEAAAGEW